ncbi:uncharacterized protein LOC112190979 isoform X2 [Rosa chinensis]|nr:uncharacterized protein LOC112190979 isoform X2 [Rosa chinensis]
MMMVSRYFRRTLFATAKSEPSGAASMAKMTAHNPLEEFFEADLDPPMTCRTRFVISSNPEIAGIVPEPDIDTYMKVKNCCHPIGKTENFVPRCSFKLYLIQVFDLPFTFLFKNTTSHTNQHSIYSSMLQHRSAQEQGKSTPKSPQIHAKQY